MKKAIVSAVAAVFCGAMSVFAASAGLSFEGNDPETGAITISFDDSFAGEGGAAVMRADLTAMAYIRIGLAEPGESTYTDATAAYGKKYSYRLAPVDALGNAGAMSDDSVTAMRIRRIERAASDNTQIKSGMSALPLIATTCRAVNAFDGDTGTFCENWWGGHAYYTMYSVVGIDFGEPYHIAKYRSYATNLPSRMSNMQMWGTNDGEAIATAKTLDTNAPENYPAAFADLTGASDVLSQPLAYDTQRWYEIETASSNAYRYAYVWAPQLPGDGWGWCADLSELEFYGWAESDVVSIDIVDRSRAGDTVSLTVLCNSKLVGGQIYGVSSASSDGLIAAEGEAIGGTIAAGEQFRQVVFDVSAGDAYAGIKVKLGDDVFMGEAIELSALPSRSLAAPSGALRGCAPTVSGAVFGVLVGSMGEGAESCDIKLAYGRSQDDLAYTNTLSTVDAEGIASVTFSELMPDTAYFGKIVLENNLGNQVGICDTFAFSTLGEAIVAGVNMFPCIYQARVFGNNWDLGFDIKASSDCGTVAGCYALHYADYTGWTVTYPDGSTGISTWTDYITFGYTFWMHFDAAEYAFTGVIDDNCNVYISADGSDLGTLVLANWYGAQDTRTWTCEAAGWYKVTIYCGNGSGGFGAYAGIPGASWRKTSDTAGEWQDGGGNWWNTFTDSNGVRFFDILACDEAAAISSQLLNGDTATASVVFNQKATGGTVKVYWASDYAGNDPADWNEISGDFGTVGAGGSVDMSVDVPSGAAYIRYAAVKDGITYWSAANPVAEIEAVDNSVPRANYSSTGSVAYNSAVVNGAVISCGEGCSECDIVVEYGYTADDLEFSQTFAGSVPGPFSATLANLAPARTYYARLYATNENDQVSEPSAIFTFTTGSIPSAGPGASMAGLWEAHAGVWVNNVMDYEHFRVLQPYEADVYSGGTGTASWPGWDTNGNEVVISVVSAQYYLYSGYIYLDDVTYKIFTDVDDHAWTYIAGELVYDSGRAWGVASLTPSEKAWWTGPGWYSFALETQDGGGGAGPWDGKTIGAGWNTNGWETVDSSLAHWNYFRDPGDGSFLRVSPPVRGVTVDSYTVADGRFTAELSLSSWQTGETAWLGAAWGSNCGGATTNDWDGAGIFATITTNDASVSYVGPAGAHETYYYVRFYAIGENGEFEWSTDAIYVPDASRPAFAGDVAADGKIGDTITVKGAVSVAGSGATAQLVVYVSENPDMSGAIEWDGPVLAAGESFEYVMHEADVSAADYLTPGSTWYLRPVLVGANGKTDVAPVITVVTAAASAIASVSASTSNAFATFNMTASTVGAGERATVYLYTGFDQNAMTNTASKVLTPSDLSFSVTVEFPEVDRTVYYAFMISNDCPTQVWTSWSATGAAGLVDAYQYSWKPSVHNGAWADAANWTVPGSPKQATWPHTIYNTVSFSADETGEPYLVTLDRGVNVSWFGVFSDGMDLTIQGTGKDANGNYASTIYYNDWWQAAYNRTDMALTLKDLYIDAPRIFLYDGDYYTDHVTYVLDGTHFRARNDTYIYGHNHTLELKNGARYSQDGGSFLQSGRNFHMIIDDSVFIEPSGGCCYLVRNTDFSVKDADGKGFCLVEFKGASPMLESRYFSIAAGDMSGEVAITPELRFSVPAAGYGENGPIHCYNDNGHYFLAGNVAVDFTIANDSPARRTGGITATLVKCEAAGGFNFSHINLGRFISYDSEDEESATKIVAVFPRGGLTVFVK